MQNLKFANNVNKIKGPILILGAGGFIGANLFRKLLSYRQDVFGVVRSLGDWRLVGIDQKNIVEAELLNSISLKSIFLHVKPITVFNCAAYGAYSFEHDSETIYRTNFYLPLQILEILKKIPGSIYVHAGSSSEYGTNSNKPKEETFLKPNSHYAVSKISTAQLIYYFGQRESVPCVNLRLYSVYGPWEDSSRLIPNLIRYGQKKEYPPFVNPNISRDFIYIDDACEAFVKAALNITTEHYGESFNIGSGRKITIQEIAEIASKQFSIPFIPNFGEMKDRSWDVEDWCSDSDKALQIIHWNCRTLFEDGLVKTIQWYSDLIDKDSYHSSSKKYQLDRIHSISAIVACYKDAQAIPIMYERLRRTFYKLKTDYEIIFVNDNSPDDSEDQIRNISAKDRRVIGITHSRNFGSQAAFKSGLEIATKNSCVMLDGDLQDPPELIEQFVVKWKEGFDVVYGSRIDREGGLFLRYSSKLFYRILRYFSYIPIPHDAGDFALIDRRVFEHMLQFPERDLFLRGVRAFVGFKQTGVPYIRPERMFGKSTNNFWKNISWAKKGILSYSNSPLNLISVLGMILFVFSICLGMLQIIIRLVWPELVPTGVTTILLMICFFGSLNLFAAAIIGEYTGKIFEEVKKRPLFIRKSIIKEGETKDFNEFGEIYRSE